MYQNWKYIPWAMEKVSDLPKILSKLYRAQNSLSIYLLKDLVLCYLIHPRLDHVDIGRPEHRPHRDPLPTRAAQYQDLMLKGLSQKMDWALVHRYG
jgi:hypothetical protein